MFRRMTLALALLASSTTYSAPDLFIGTQGLGHVSPAAAWPFGMVQAGPDTSKSAERYVADWPHTCGYQFDDRFLWRFSQCRFYGIGCGSMGFFGLLPSDRPFAQADHAYAKEMDKAAEKAVPGYYAVTLKEGNVRCEMSALAHSAAYRFDFGRSGRAYLLVDPGWGCQLGAPDGDVDLKSPGAYFSGFVLDCESRQQTATRLALHAHSVSWNEIECWGVAELSSPIVSSRRLRTARFPQGEIVEYAFDLPASGVLEVRLALSRTSIRAAAKNLAAEMPVFDFEGVRTKVAAEWERRLGTLTLDPATPEPTKTIFESAFYRAMIHPSDLGDVGGKAAYSNLSLWDIFRACSPLQTIVAPDVTGGLVESMCDIFDRQGYLPILHAWGVDNHCMVGHHAVPVIVDACLKGIGGFDAERAYEAVKDSLTVMHVKAGNGTWGLLKEDWDVWDAYGYYPFDKLTGEYHGQVVKGESVSRTLECAYNDACAARFAAALGKKDDAAFFAKRAQNWKNVYDASVGFMRGKDSSGRWREPFDPKSCGAGPWAENDFTEGNAWQYTWHVMHDIPGLVAAMGGKEKFGAKLQALFEQTDEVYGTSFTHDVSGLIGQYAHGNEPSHHVAYLFRFSDRPEKTDEYVNRICRELYKATPDGCCGNDDSGQMAAWYVFSALGFYPVDACGGEYVIGCPQVEKVTLRCSPSPSTFTSFTVVARGLSKGNKHVKSVTLNGEPITDWKIRHADIMKGGVLEFEMVSPEIVIRPDGDRDMTKEIVEAVRTANAAGGGTVRLEKGVYHLFAASAEKMSFHISNHDQPDVRPVFLPFAGIRNVTVESEGAHLVMHGMGTALLLQGTEGFTLRGVTISWAKPYFARGTVAGFENGRTRLCFPARDEVVVRDGKLVLLGEDWEHQLIGGNVYDGKTHEILEGTADVMLDGANETCADGSVLVGRDLLAVGAKVGDVYVLRSWNRPHPAICLDRAKDTVFEDVVYRDGFGMGIVAQLSENFRMSGGGCFPASADDYCSNTFDATHFSNCRGQVTVENSRFEGMHDDALNVHSTCLGVIAKPGADAIRCRYMHEQAVGFGVFSAGDTVRFIRGRTLENGWMCRVKSVRTIDEREVELTLEDVVPEGYGVGDAVENADWQCAVVFRNNVIRNNRARGVLFTTPKKIVCEGNFFDHVSGSAILLAGDAQGWYESGACQDVSIRRNRFRNCLTSSYQYCDALVSVHPEVKDLSGQRQRYHRNVTIEDNDIETFDIPLLYALSAEDLVWRNNRVTFNSDYTGWKRKRFETLSCENVRIDGVD